MLTEQAHARLAYGSRRLCRWRGAGEEDEEALLAALATASRSNASHAQPPGGGASSSAVVRASLDEGPATAAFADLLSELKAEEGDSALPLAAPSLLSWSTRTQDAAAWQGGGAPAAAAAAAPPASAPLPTPLAWPKPQAGGAAGSGSGGRASPAPASPRFGRPPAAAPPRAPSSPGARAQRNIQWAEVPIKWVEGTPSSSSSSRSSSPARSPERQRQQAAAAAAAAPAARPPMPPGRVLRHSQSVSLLGQTSSIGSAGAHLYPEAGLRASPSGGGAHDPQARPARRRESSGAGHGLLSSGGLSAALLATGEMTAAAAATVVPAMIPRLAPLRSMRVYAAAMGSELPSPARSRMSR